MIKKEYENLVLIADTGHTSPSNEPLHLPPLIGREQELRTICVLVQSPRVRWLTLTGTAGIGKTFLALHVLARLQDTFDSGSYFVPLTSISDPELILPTIAHALGLMEAADQPLLARLKADLYDKHLLLVLDNFEQTLVSPLLVELLEACPYLKVLATSREVLHVHDEHTFPVPPLLLPRLNRLPNLESLLQCAAVALFVQHAQTIKPDFELTGANAREISEICTYLDGLPLAIELAAAHIKHFSPQELLEQVERRLRLAQVEQDAPVRQCMLRCMIQWSYSLLNEEEQKLFRRLSACRGGCTLASLDAVGRSFGDMTTSTLSGVASLIERHLIQERKLENGEPRLLLHATIREYGIECLEMSAEAEVVRRAYTTYYIRLVEEGGPALKSERQATWLKRLEREHDNLREVLGWLLEWEEVERAFRFCGVLWRFWNAHGYLAEGHWWLERLKRGFGYGCGPAVVREGKDVINQGRESMDAFITINRPPTEGRIISLEGTFTTQGQVAPSASVSGCVKAVSSPALITANGDLTEREVEVLHLLALGLSNTQIAEQLIISPRTVHAHVRSIYNKLGVTSRSAATRYAIQHQIA